MGMFKNEVGRPSNETIKKRNIFKGICVLLVLIIIVLLAYILNDKGIINIDNDKYFETLDNYAEQYNVASSNMILVSKDLSSEWFKYVNGDYENLQETINNVIVEDQEFIKTYISSFDELGGLYNDLTQLKCKKDNCDKIKSDVEKSYKSINKFKALLDSKDENYDTFTEKYRKFKTEVQTYDSLIGGYSKNN